MGEHEGAIVAAPAGLSPLPAFATPSPGRQGGGKARLLDFGVDKAAEGDVAGKVGPVRPRNNEEGIHRRGVGRRVAAGVGDPAQVEREGLRSLVTRAAGLA